MASQEIITKLEEKCRDIRVGTVRYVEATGVGHIGGSLSMTEIAVALYYHTMRLRLDDPAWPQRDRLVLSKGHCCDTLAAIFMDKGLYTFEQVVRTYEKGPDTIFSMHPCRKFVPYYEASTGALGHGMPIACGMALAARQYHESWRTFCVIGDGELDEGSNWEAFMTAAHYQLGNLICILDQNHLQMTDFTMRIMEHLSLAEKLTAFGWRVVECDGNDMSSVLAALESCPAGEATQTGKPLFIIANTIKGKGVDFMENRQPWHGGSISKEDADAAVRCIMREGSREDA